MPSILSAKKSTKESLSLTDILGLNIQKILSQISFVIFGPIIFYMIYKKFKLKLDDLKTIRKQYQKLIAEDGPILICPNHLTLVDSIIHAVFLNSIMGYLFNFKSLPWNLPEKKNFYHKLHWKLICYLGKCIPVQRKAPPREGKKSLQKMLYILNKKQILSIFPEGKRSRDGMVDINDYSYGVGQIIKQYPTTKVICLYMKGKKAGGFADFPIKEEEYYFKMEMISPDSTLTGLRKVRDLSKQVITKLKEMENEYYSQENLSG